MTPLYYGGGVQRKVTNGKLYCYFAKKTQEKITKGVKNTPKLGDIICEYHHKRRPQNLSNFQVALCLLYDLYNQD